MDEVKSTEKVIKKRPSKIRTRGFYDQNHDAITGDSIIFRRNLIDFDLQTRVCVNDATNKYN